MKRLLCLGLALILSLSVPMVLSEEEHWLWEGGDETLVVASEARTLSYRDEGDDVLQLQKRLKELLYYRGPLSGSYMELTRDAVRAVQTAYGLEVTGSADPETQEIIYGDCLRPLARGSEGEDVARLQTRLQEIGYYWGKISGNYLEGTTAAVGHFQEDNGLVKSGKADIETLTRLYGDDIVVPTPDPKVTPTPLPSPTATPDTAYSGRLSYGSKGKKVSQLQERLAELGFFDRKVTGGFYEHTAKAVTEFQRFNGLKADGVVGEMTWEALYASDPVTASHTPRPTPEPTPVPYFIEVDVNNQLVKIYERDEAMAFTVLTRIFTCSTGTKSYPSDVGTFTLTGRKALWAFFPNWGGGYARYWVRINPSIAFHSFLYKSNRLNDVNMSSVKKLGSRASHGCIRLTVPDAKWIYDNCGKGVDVRIREDIPSDPELKYAHRPGSYSSSSNLHVVTPTPPPPPQNVKTLQSDIKAMKKGAEGLEVFWLQTLLKDLGYFSGTVTGQYREGTQAAVKAYQKANKLSADGQVGSKTLESLSGRAHELWATAEPAPVDPFLAGALPSEPSPTPFPTSDFRVE